MTHTGSGAIRTKSRKALSQCCAPGHTALAGQYCFQPHWPSSSPWSATAALASTRLLSNPKCLSIRASAGSVMFLPIILPPSAKSGDEMTFDPCHSAFRRVVHLALALNPSEATT